MSMAPIEGLTDGLYAASLHTYRCWRPPTRGNPTTWARMTAETREH